VLRKPDDIHIELFFDINYDVIGNDYSNALKIISDIKYLVYTYLINKYHRY